MLFIGAFRLVRLAGGQEGKQAHRRSAGIAAGDVAWTSATLVARNALGGVVLHAPVSLAMVLVVGQPDQGRGHSAFGLLGAAAAGELLLAAALTASAESGAPVTEARAEA